jgi:hypothetical protein
MKDESKLHHGDTEITEITEKSINVLSSLFSAISVSLWWIFSALVR